MRRVWLLLENVGSSMRIRIGHTSLSGGQLFPMTRITPRKSLVFIGGVSAHKAGRAPRRRCRDTFDNET